MRDVLRATAVALVFLAVTGPLAQAQTAPKFAYVNSQLLLRDAPGRAEAQAQFEKEMTTFQRQVQQMGDSLKSMIEEYEKQEVSLSPTVKDSRQKAIRDKEGEYQERVRRIEGEAQKRQGELMQPIMASIMKVIEEVRTSDGYTMIFDVGVQNGIIVAADKNLDITDKVMIRLRQTASAKPAGAPIASPTGATRPKTPPKP